MDHCVFLLEFGTRTNGNQRPYSQVSKIKQSHRCLLVEGEEVKQVKAHDNIIALALVANLLRKVVVEILSSKEIFLELLVIFLQNEVEDCKFVESS